MKPTENFYSAKNIETNGSIFIFCAINYIFQPYLISFLPFIPLLYKIEIKLFYLKNKV